MIHSGDHSVRVVCSELTHLENYTQPNAPGMTRYCGRDKKKTEAVNTVSMKQNADIERGREKKKNSRYSKWSSYVLYCWLGEFCLTVCDRLVYSHSFSVSDV